MPRTFFENKELRTFFENKELKLKRIDNIINVSLRLFATYGYKKVTIDMITKECRYSHGLFYHYFSSKSEVLREIRKRSNALFSEKFLAISKTSSLGYEVLFALLLILLIMVGRKTIMSIYYFRQNYLN